MKSEKRSKIAATAVSFATIVLVAASAALPAFGGIGICTDYPGANVKVLGIDETNGIIRIMPDFRDTRGKWFRFDFVLTGAAGRKLHFQFPDDKYNYLSTLGPAISSDKGATWRWLNADGTRHEPANAFDYTFAADENETRFAVSIPYQQSDWEKFTAKWKNRPDVKFDVLCKSQSGKRDTELLRLPCRGMAKWLFAFTARHHASETTGNAVMEGAIEEVLSGSAEGEWLRENADCVFVPFMDKDGVEEGDQGKNRRPHDHNRDYIEGRYTSVRALRELLVSESNGKQIVFFDLHAPGVRSTAKTKVHDHVFTFDSFMPEKCARMNAFRQYWVEAQKGGALAYDGKRDSLKGAKGRKEYEANKKKGLMTSRQWVQDLPNCWMSICGEFGYSLCGGVFSLEAGRELGRNMLKAGVRTVRVGIAE